MMPQSFKPSITPLDFQDFGGRVECLMTMPELPGPDESFFQILRIRTYADGSPIQEPKLLIICALSPDDLNGFWYFEKEIWTLLNFLTMSMSRVRPSEWLERLHMARPVEVEYKAINLDQLIIARSLMG